MFVRLEITTPGQGVQKSKIDGPQITLGRDPASQIPFDGKASSAVSWQHARIEMAAGGASVTDLGSSNGTFVNGAQVAGKKTIQQGDIIGLGQTGPKLRIVEIALAPPPPIQATVAEKMLPHGMLTPPVGNASLNVSSDAPPSRRTKRRRRSPVGGIVLGLLAIGVVAAAGFVVFKSQPKTDDQNAESTAEKPNDDRQAKAGAPLDKKDARQEAPKDVSDPNAADPSKKEAPKPAITEPPRAPTPSLPVPVAPKTESEIYRRTLQSTGWVTVPKTPLIMATGTGALIDQEKRLFLTAYHVIEEATEANIFFPRNDDEGRPIAIRKHYQENERPVVGDVVHRDKKRDLAILRLRSLPASVVPLPLAAKSVEPAHKVYTVGNPGVSGGLWVYSDGYVRQVVPKRFRMNNNQEVDAWMIEAQLAINQGDSGGPVVNDKIELVGVNCSYVSKAQSFSNCIELREIQFVLEQARRNQNTFGAGPINRGP